jgi:serine phosphatase RsbU (regulator of sigma subunit)
VVIGDVTDKGVPAALLMATTRSILRSVAYQYISPGLVLERVNNLLEPDIPDRMFITCMYTVIDLASGRVQFANAGHNLPCHRKTDGVTELRATGMPLGLMPDMCYEEREAIIHPGECLLFYSDGLVEAHNRKREMFGGPRLNDLMKAHSDDPDFLDFLLEELRKFTGPDWDQEDDVTLVKLRRIA